MELTEKQKSLLKKQKLENTKIVDSYESSMSNLKKAEDHFTAAIKLNPMFDDAFYWRGKNRIKMGKLDEGEKDIRRALEINPRNERAQALLSKVEAEKFLEETKEAQKSIWNDFNTAIRKNLIESVKSFISAGYPLDARGANGETLLHMASIFGRKEISQLLIDNGADVNATDKVNATPLHDAEIFEHFEIAKILIKAGANLNAEDNYNRRPSEIAETEKLKKLLQPKKEKKYGINRKTKILF